MPVSLAPAKASSATIIGFVLTAILLAICVLSGKFIGLLPGQHLSSTIQFFISRLLFWLSLAIIFLYVVKIEKQPLLLWPEKNYGIKFYCLSIFILIISVIAGSAIIGIIAHVVGVNTKSSAVQAMLRLGIPLKLLTVITAAVVEELIFRGYLMPRLQLFFKNKYWPIIISSLFFGLGHFRYGTLINVAGPVFIGLIFAWYYQKYRNIKVLIICHFIIDFSSLILFHK